MLRIERGRKVFCDEGTWYHCDYKCRREVVKIGTWREAIRFLRYRPDPFGSPKLRWRGEKNTLELALEKFA